MSASCPLCPRLRTMLVDRYAFPSPPRSPSLPPTTPTHLGPSCTAAATASSATSAALGVRHCPSSWPKACSIGLHPGQKTGDVELGGADILEEQGIIRPLQAAGCHNAPGVLSEAGPNARRWREASLCLHPGPQQDHAARAAHGKAGGPRCAHAVHHHEQVVDAACAQACKRVHGAVGSRCGRQSGFGGWLKTGPQSKAIAPSLTPPSAATRPTNLHQIAAAGTRHPLQPPAPAPSRSQPRASS